MGSLYADKRSGWNADLRNPLFIGHDGATRSSWIGREGHRSSQAVAYLDGEGTFLQREGRRIVDSQGRGRVCASKDECRERESDEERARESRQRLLAQRLSRVANCEVHPLRPVGPERFMQRSKDLRALLHPADTALPRTVTDGPLLLQPT